jgi:hypothetical protein
MINLCVPIASLLQRHRGEEKKQDKKRQYQRQYWEEQELFVSGDDEDGAFEEHPASLEFGYFVHRSLSS